jgi:glycolate oxidase FAD binding subunit
VIGIHAIDGRGTPFKGGGRVVKNVAGYDLGKLVTGSYGALAAIVDATFKLLPLPHASATLRAVYNDQAALAADAVALAAGQLEPLAFDVRAAATTREGTRWSLLVRFASSPAAVASQLDAARALLRGDTTALRDGMEARTWAEQVVLPWDGEGAVVRCSWLPSRLAEVIALLDTMGEGCEVALAGRVVTGSGLVRLTGPDAAIAAAVGRAREASSPVGHVVLLRGSRAVRAQVDVWGAAPSTPAVALKRALDPAGILNAGRGPV